MCSVSWACVQGIMGSVSSLIPGAKHCRGSEHAPDKGYACKRGGMLKHGFSREHSRKNNSSSSSKLGLDSVGSGNSDDFFYIKVSHKPRGEEPPDDSRETPTELSARLEQNAESSFLPQFPRSSSSSVETHNSLHAILGASLGHIGPKNQTPEPKLDMSSGSPCDSGIYGSSWTNDGANGQNKWTGGVHGDGGTSDSSTRSTSALSDCTFAPGSIKTDTAAKTLEIPHTSPFPDRNFPSSMGSEVSEERQLYDSEVSQHALRAQQLLQLQVLQLQQDKDLLQQEVDQLIRDRDAAESQLLYKHRHTPLTPTLEETQWEVCQKVGEISLLKQQLKDSQADVSNKLSEIVCLKAALRETRSRVEDLEEKRSKCEETLRLRTTEMEVCENELQRKKNEAELLREKAGKLEMDAKSLKQDLQVAKEEHLELLSLKVQIQEQQHLLQTYQSMMAEQETSEKLNVLQNAVERLRDQLEDEKQKKEEILSSFHGEKQTWNKEKDKVIHYQKQLQFNYLQMQRRNQELEKKLKERNRKVDNRTERDRTQEDSKVQKTEVHFEELVATVI